MAVTRRVKLAVIVAAVGATLAACGGGGSSDEVTTGNSSGQAAQVTVHSGPMGDYLTDGQGRTLYIFEKDTSATSTCSGACLEEWPPYTTSGSPTASGGVKDAKLSTSSRDDGSTQVVYAGHPLYYFDEDESAGDTKGQGRDDFGGRWTMVTPAGAPVTTTSTPSGGSSSPDDSGPAWG